MGNDHEQRIEHSHRLCGHRLGDRAQIPVSKAGLIPQAIVRDNWQCPTGGTKHGIPEVYATWQELSSIANVDVVSVCSPPATHTEITVAALAAGKHILCEKRLRSTWAGGASCCCSVAPNRLPIIDHELRFDPAASLRQLVKDGFVGTPRKST